MQDENVIREAEKTAPVSETASTVSKPEKKNPIPLLTILNVVLLIGLIILYFIVLRADKGNDNPALKQKVSTGSLSVAYVNSDSIFEHYDFVKSMRDELETKTSRLENELKKKQESFEKDASYFQEQVNKKTLSEASQQEIYAQLMNEQQKLYDLREQYSSEISKQQFDLQNVLIDSLDNFLKRYNKKMHFDYILSYSRGGNILTANDSLDITRDVIDLLNKEYATSKK